jgi:hypothetical protein
MHIDMGARGESRQHFTIGEAQFETADPVGDDGFAIDQNLEHETALHLKSGCKKRTKIERASGRYGGLVAGGRRCRPRVLAIRFIEGYLIIIFVGAAVAYDASSPRTARGWK